jgi:RNA polymerase sigma-70 factor (ECF subfamily)
VRIAVNEALNRRRAAGRRATLALRVGEDRSLETVPGSPELAALAGEQRARLLTALAALREDDQLVIATRLLLDMSEADAAAALGVRRGTVKSRLSRALERLRVELGQ